MSDHDPASRLCRQIRLLLLFFIAALLVSGLTAFPIETELSIVNELAKKFNIENELTGWLEKVYLAVHEANFRHPYLSYGTDWLAFAHVIIAIAFLGPVKDPVRNIWVIEFGLISCVAVIPHALIAGQIRDVPLAWRVFDCMFGVVGLMILYACYRKIQRLQNIIER